MIRYNDLRGIYRGIYTFFVSDRKISIIQTNLRSFQCEMGFL